MITISHMGYIKRTPLTEYRTQIEVVLELREVRHVMRTLSSISAADAQHNAILPQNGRCYWLKVYEIPEGAVLQKVVRSRM